MNLRVARVLGIVERLVAPQLSTCKRCGRPWNRVEPHSTPYNDGSACFPLCEGCWKELTPESRLPYYSELYRDWRGFGGSDHNGAPWDEVWGGMKQAVERGL